MIGSFLSRVFIMVLGYAYPAYECFKTVERNKPEIEQLRFWCQYWILVAVLGVFERVGDTCISWLPMYSEAKLAFFIYLWCPKTKGTTYVYDTFLRPYLASHESEIDRNLLELRERAGDIVVLYWQKAAAYGQTRFFDILQYVASQSHGSRSRSAQQREQQQQISQHPSTPTAGQPTTPQPQPPQVHAPSSPMKSKVHVAIGGGAAAAVATAAVSLPSQAQAPLSPRKSGSESNIPAASHEEATQVEEGKSSSNNLDSNAPQEAVMEETIRLTRGRLRRTRAAITSNHAATAVTATGSATSHY